MQSYVQIWEVQGEENWACHLKSFQSDSGPLSSLIQASPILIRTQLTEHLLEGESCHLLRKDCPDSWKLQSVPSLSTFRHNLKPTIHSFWDGKLKFKGNYLWDSEIHQELFGRRRQHSLWLLPFRKTNLERSLCNLQVEPQPTAFFLDFSSRIWTRRSADDVREQHSWQCVDTRLLVKKCYLPCLYEYIQVHSWLCSRLALSSVSFGDQTNGIQDFWRTS